ncbi:MAG: 5'/3'-nucleotidase SurE, partial [Deltaproteobacteria bacterium]|nr:5'/3'-nucleotidase SurE [Deltaproteobacteria bacterium]
LNVNVPAGDVKGYRITKQGKRFYGDSVVEKIDPRGKKYYWIGGDILRWEGGKDTDFEAVVGNFISITPVHLDMTNYASFKELHNWKI